VTGNDAFDRHRAWAALSANVTVPGLGSLLLGRRAGWVQVSLAVCGMALSLTWLALVLFDWKQGGALPAAVPRRGLLLAGLGLFAVAWIWALATGLDAVHRARARMKR
jgi:hypothetical protein